MRFIGIAVAALLVLSAGVFAVVRLGADGTRALRAGSATSTYPQEWDPRIAPYAKIAEDLRGLDFQHPVTVRFLAPDKFEKTVTSDEKKLHKKDRLQFEQTIGLMRAFGLISGDVDLFAAVNDFNGSSTLAYYSFDDKTITIRGDRLNPAVRSTLVHELTHALQDQHFDVGDRMEQLHKESKHGASTAEASVLGALIEGDAERVQSLYRDSLSEREREALDAAQQDESSRAGPRIEQIPKVIVTILASSYTLGQALVQTVAVDGGNSAVDDLFRHTPTHESVLLDPFRVLADDTDEIRVDAPKLRNGERKFDSGELGAPTWYLMLAERLPLRTALAAADGWGGDTYVAFERADESCARMTYAGSTTRDTTRMFMALQRWIAAAPGSPASVTSDGDALQLETCDPGNAAAGGRDASGDAISLALTRTYLGIGIMRGGASDTTSRCVAGRLVRAFPVSKLTDPTFGVGEPVVLARVRQVAAGCI